MCYTFTGEFCLISSIVTSIVEFEIFLDICFVFAGVILVPDNWLVESSMVGGFEIKQRCYGQT